MIQHEYSFTRNLPIENFFSLMIQHIGNHQGWKVEPDLNGYTIVWTPTIFYNIWQVHPKVIATLEKVSEGTTRCRVLTTNRGRVFIDLFGIFKRVHKKSYTQLLGPIRQATKEYATAPEK